MSRLLLFGMGVEGRAALEYAHQHTNWDVTAIDQDPSLTLPYNTPVVSEERATALLTPGAFIWRSPGIPPTNRFIQAAVSAGHSVTTPTGYWLQTHAPTNTVTITGTKGKSTTASLLCHLLTEAGHDSAALGNIGAPPLSGNLPTAGHPVIELSSYMMHDLPSGAYTHLVTSLYREHTDWHGSEHAYREAKLRPFFGDNPSSGYAPKDLITRYSLPACVQAIETVIPASNGALTIGDTPITPRTLNDRFSSPGDMAALRAACAVSLDRLGADTLIKTLERALPAYRGLPSRQENVPSHDGRLWINDALATVPQATLQAVERFAGRPLTLLLGGADRGQDFRALVEGLAATPTLTAIVFGSTGDALAPALTKAGVSVQHTESFTRALEQATINAPKDAVILFSPAAASEPPHRNFEERAALFRSAASNA